MPADLRSVIARLTTFKCTWTAAEVAALVDVPMRGVRAYLSTLVHQRVLIITGEHYTPGPKAKGWREHKPKRKGPSTYGNSSKYREQQTIWDALKLRDWKAGRAEGATPLTSNEVQADTTQRTETQTMGSVSHQPALTIDQVAELLSVSKNTVRNQIGRGKLKSFRAGERGVRISAEELDRYRAIQAADFEAKA